METHREHGCVMCFMICERCQTKQLQTVYIRSHDILEKAKNTGSEMRAVAAWGRGEGRTSGGGVLDLQSVVVIRLHPSKRVSFTIYKWKSKF